MQYDIPDTAAVRFSEAFYRTLAAGHGIDLAVTEGRKAILLEQGRRGQCMNLPPVLSVPFSSGELFSGAIAPVRFRLDISARSPIFPRPALMSKIRSLLVDANTGQGVHLLVGVRRGGQLRKNLPCQDDLP